MKYSSAAISLIFLVGLTGAVHGEQVSVDNPVLGQEDAEVTMEVWCDFQGNYCEKLNEEVLSEIEQDYVDSGDVKIVWRDKPIEAIHEWAKDGAIAMECVYREGGNEAFWKIVDRVYMNQDSLSKETVQNEIISYAEDYGIEENNMENCLSENSVSEEIESDLEIAKSHEIRGTPTVFINDQKIVGAQPLSNFTKKIETELNEDQEEPAENNNEEDSESDYESRSDPVLGQKESPVKITVYEDFQCPFCQQFEQEVMPKIKSNYVDAGQAKIVWKDLPLPQIGHEWAEPAAATMECVYRQDNQAFWSVKERIYSNQDVISTDNVQSTIKDWASQEGVSSDTVQSCLENGNPMAEVNGDSQEAEEAGASGTPTIFINDEKIVGAQPYRQFESVIESELNGDQEEKSSATDNNTEKSDSDTNATELQERLNQSQSNITELKERLNEQQKEIDELEKQQNAILDILDTLMSMLGL